MTRTVYHDDTHLCQNDRHLSSPLAMLLPDDWEHVFVLFSL